MVRYKEEGRVTNPETECCHCKHPVIYCQCDKTETLNSEDGALCPYCGELNKPKNSKSLLFKPSTNSWTCSSCDRQFELEVFIFWDAKRKENIRERGSQTGF